MNFTLITDSVQEGGCALNCAQELLIKNLLMVVPAFPSTAEENCLVNVLQCYTHVFPAVSGIKTDVSCDEGCFVVQRNRTD